MSFSRSITLCVALMAALGNLQVANSASLTPEETASGINAAITRGAEFAVDQLGKKDGFMGNPKVRIGLPESFLKAEKAARSKKGGKSADNAQDEILERTLKNRLPTA